MVVKCVLSREGLAKDCQVVKPLPHVEQAILRTLDASRYTPVTLRGEPIDVEYTFHFRLTSRQYGSATPSP